MPIDGWSSSTEARRGSCLEWTTSSLRRLGPRAGARVRRSGHAMRARTRTMTIRIVDARDGGSRRLWGSHRLWESAEAICRNETVVLVSVSGASVSQWCQSVVQGGCDDVSDIGVCMSDDDNKCCAEQNHHHHPLATTFLAFTSTTTSSSSNSAPSKLASSYDLLRA